MDRKGHIGTMLLPFIALILVVNALVVMHVFNGNIDEEKAQIRIVSDKAFVGHELVFNSLNESVSESISNSNKEDFELSFRNLLKDSVEKLRNSGVNTNIYAKLAVQDYSLDLSNGVYELMVKDVFENYDNFNNEVSYKYSIRVLFDMDKIILIEKI